MLHFFARLAHRLHPLRALLWVLAGAALAAFVATLFVFSGQDASWLFVATVAFLWAVCLLLITRAFVHPLPVVAPGAGRFARLRVRLARAALWLLAVVMSVLCGFVVYLSLSGIGMVMRALSG